MMSFVLNRRGSKPPPPNNKTMDAANNKMDSERSTVDTVDTAVSQLSLQSADILLPPVPVCATSRIPTAVAAASPITLLLAPPPLHSPRSPRRHARHGSLTDDDFNGLLYKSRGWAFDPSSAATRPHHHQHNRALASTDFEKFIFRPAAPRLWDGSS